MALRQRNADSAAADRAASWKRHLLDKDRQDLATEKQRFAEEKKDFAEQKKALAEDKNAFAEEKMAFEASKHKLADCDATSRKAAVQDNKNADTNIEGDRVEKVLSAASMCHWAFGTAMQQFNANPRQVDWSDIRLPSDFNVDINDKRIKQLRQHDYYKGWLDSMSAFDTLQAWSDGKVSLEAIQYLFDLTDIRSPLNAGRNVGMIFGWSAACSNNDMPQHDARLDDRVWGLHRLVPRSKHIAGSGRDFWQGVKWGKETAIKLFEMKVESGSWQISQDPKQMEYLKKACRQGAED